MNTETKGRKLAYLEAVERINDGHAVSADGVLSRAAVRQVWCCAWGAPGCLPDNDMVATSLGDALAWARDYYADTAPRGFMTRLRKHGIAATDDAGFHRVTITKMQLSDLLI